MRLATISRLAAALLLLEACQSNTFKISGTAEGFAEGDTIHLSVDREEGKPMQSTVVRNGRFELTGEVDSMTMCFVYSAKDMATALAFFLEPATIEVKLSQVPGASRVSGTKVNEALQALNDSAFAFQKEIERFASQMGLDSSEEMSDTQHQQLEDFLRAQANKLTNVVYLTAQKNIDNELGYLIATDNNGISDEQRLRLINSMPPKMRKRPDVMELEQALKTGGERMGNMVEGDAIGKGDANQ